MRTTSILFLFLVCFLVSQALFAQEDAQSDGSVSSGESTGQTETDGEASDSGTSAEEDADEGGKAAAKQDEDEEDRQTVLPDEDAAPEGDEEGFIEPYGLGSQLFTIDLGLFRPLFFHFPGADSVDDLNKFESAFGQMTLGGTGSLAWGSYLTPRLALGVELAGSFSFSPNGYVHSLIPITMRIEYLFRKGSFEFPLHVNTGVVFNKFREQLYFGPIVIPGITAYYNVNAEWGLGLSLDYWWVPEIYFGDRADQTGFGSMLDISFSARYHFS